MPQVLTQAAITGAMTDLLGAVLLLPLLWALWRLKTDRAKEKNRWLCFFALLAVSCLLGFVAHYYCRTVLSRRLIWIPLYATLFETVNAFFRLALCRSRGEEHPDKRELWLLYGIGVPVFLVTVAFDCGLGYNMIRLYALYGTVLGLWGFWLLVRRAFAPGRRCEKLLLVTILPLLPAAWFQLRRQTLVHFIWDFDHNGLTHLFIIVSMFLLFAAAFTGLKSREESEKAGTDPASDKQTRA